MNKPPRCRYAGFKYCPQKPYLIRESYPFGNIVKTDIDGCQHWWIDFIELSREGGKEIQQIAMCCDLWNMFYLKASNDRTLGTQRATEQLRNGLCEEVGGQVLPKGTNILLSIVEHFKEQKLKRLEQNNKI